MQEYKDTSHEKPLPLILLRKLLKAIAEQIRYVWKLHKQSREFHRNVEMYGIVYAINKMNDDALGITNTL